MGRLMVKAIHRNIREFYLEELNWCLKREKLYYISLTNWNIDGIISLLLRGKYVLLQSL